VFVSDIDHVPALERRNRHHGGHGDAGTRGKRTQCRFDVAEGQRRVGHRVELVDREHDGGHAQQVAQQRVAAGLHQQLQRRVAPVEFGGVHQHHGGVGATGGCHHVAGVLLVAGCVTDDELAVFGGEVAVGHVDGDALLALGREAVGQQGQVGFSLALHPRQVVLEHGLAVHQQAADQGALAVVHRAAGDELQGDFGVFLAITQRGIVIVCYQFRAMCHVLTFWGGGSSTQRFRGTGFAGPLVSPPARG
jgi:hypothetical protein